MAIFSHPWLKHTFICVKVTVFFYSHACVCVCERERKKGSLNTDWEIETETLGGSIQTGYRLRGWWLRWGVSTQYVQPWDGCREEGRVGAEGERVGTSTATSSLGCRQHTGHIVQSVHLLPPSLPCLPPLPLPFRSQYSPIYPQPGSHSQFGLGVSC